MPASAASVTSSTPRMMAVTRTGISGPSAATQALPPIQSAKRAALTVWRRSSLPTRRPYSRAAVSLTTTALAAPDVRPATVTPNGCDAVLRIVPSPNRHSASGSGVIPQAAACVTSSTPGMAAASSIRSTLPASAAGSTRPRR
jgi:hypothetical protein